MGKGTLLCGNDVIAYGVMLEAERRGRYVPRDLSVMAFDDVEWSRHLRSGLTTMHLPTDEVQTHAGQYLVRHLAGQGTRLHHEAEPCLWCVNRSHALRFCVGLR